MRRAAAVLLMRHAEPDWALVEGAAWRGAANDLAPLTSTGEAQARSAADALRDDPPSRVLSSPMTRALQTAAIIAGALGVGLSVDLDLREWLPDRTYQWTTDAEVIAAYDEMIQRDGVPDDATWESLASVRDRAMRAFEPCLARPGPTLVVCHEVLIHALTGHRRTRHTEIRELRPGSAF